VIDCHVVPGLGVDPIMGSGHQWRGGSRGAGLDGTRLVVLSWKLECLGDDGAGAQELSLDPPKRTHGMTRQR
jgi:hypothetical protein